MADAQTVEQTNAIFLKYKRAYGNAQGVCMLIADEIAKATGGIPVAGYLCWYSGSSRRSHWWVDLEGEILDPMGEEAMEFEVGVSYEEVHRDQEEFAVILAQNEQYRV